VAELPPVVARVTEYQGHARHCPACGTLNRQSIPAAIRAHSLGPNLTAVMAYLAGCQGVSKRGIEEIVETIFAVPVALGTIAHLEQQTSAALQAAHQEARRVVADAPVKHVDETGWKEAGKKRWLWVAATTRAVVFAIHPRRNLDALTHLLGGTRQGTLVSDRWAIYDDWPAEEHQLCWAHIARNWENQAERSGPARRLAAEWAVRQGRVFELWHLFRGGGLSRTQLSDRLVPHVEALGEILHRGGRSRTAGLARFCTRLLDRFPKLWLFVEADGVEPTNNRAERVQRRAVLWRRRSFGCHSAAGCRFVERLLSVVETLKQQARPVLAYLREAIQAHRRGQPTPQLVPVIG
jgi:transposase